MGDRTAIEWTATRHPDGTSTPGATWNPIRGCSRVSKGCEHCYAERVAARASGFSQPYHGLLHASGAWNGVIRSVASALELPLHWRRPRRVFVNSMSDLFHEGVADEWLDRIFAVMALAPQHTFQVLTKRPERMRRYFDLSPDNREEAIGASMRTLTQGKHPGLIDLPLPHVWLGTSVENQETAAARIPELLDTPARVRFLSCEPLLGRIDLSLVDPHRGDPTGGALLRNGIHWVIVGGESGPRARPMDPDWARTLRDQCTAAAIPFFFKQWGEFLPAAVYDDADYAGGRAFEDPNGGTAAAEPGDHYFYHWLSPSLVAARVGKKQAGRLLDGRSWDQYPEDGQQKY